MSHETPLEYLHAIELPTPYPVGPVTAYLAGAPGEPLTLIDTGPRTGATRAALDAGLKRLGYGVPDLQRIVITHAHVDHYGLASDLVAQSQAKLWTHAWNIVTLGHSDKDRMRRISFYAELMRQAAVPDDIVKAIGQATGAVNRYAQPVAVDATLQEGDTLSMANRTWQVLHTPGHSAGLLCFYEPASQTLLSSDHLLADISSNPVVEPPPPGMRERLRSLALYRQSLERVAAIKIARALPSHGPVIDDVPGLVRQRLAFHQRRMDRVLEALCQGARTTWDVTKLLFPDLSALDTFLAISEAIGHLEVLELEGVIASSPEGDVVIWSLARPEEP
ncbi:MAG: MBL fold metallo-hydrolase [Anaerolineae bacterium]|jgi:glyoxylase-like metal-dependent hydrolase (beta-lactamase superfamily II)